MKNYIVIGGSKGIGKAVTKKLLTASSVINLSRSEPETHNNLTHFPCNVLSDNLPDIESADGLVYCPGSINLKPFKRLSLDDFQSDFNINVIGAVRVIQHYLPILKNGNNPSIVLFSSVATKLGMPFHSSIAASKSAIEGLAKSLAAEFAPKIRVNAIAPTVTDTQLSAKLLRNDKMIENMKNRHPLKNYLQPSEVADLTAFLLSETSKSMSGQIFKMDSGIVSMKL